jgi:hypothetical protein
LLTALCVTTGDEARETNTAENSNFVQTISYRGIAFLIAMSTTGVSFNATNLVQPFDGTSNFLVWVERVELVAALQGLKNLEKFVPLFLHGGAFAVYQSLEDNVKEDYDKLKAALTLAFSADPLKAYTEFVARRLQPGEQPDVFLADLRRLALLVATQPSEEWIRSAFVFGLPVNVQQQVMACCTLGKMTLSDIAEKARALVAVMEFPCFAGIGTSVGRGSRESATASTAGQRGACYTCGQHGHFSNRCPTRIKPELAPTVRKQRCCFVCGKTDHLASMCSDKKTAKNE